MEFGGETADYAKIGRKPKPKTETSKKIYESSNSKLLGLEPEYTPPDQKRSFCRFMNHLS